MLSLATGEPAVSTCWAWRCFTRWHASFGYVVGVCVLVAAVGWAYTIICRCYPDGGGVYSAAKHTSKMLAVIEVLPFLFADYIVTASLSAMDGMHYLGLSDDNILFRIGGRPILWRSLWPRFSRSF